MGARIRPQNLKTCLVVGGDSSLFPDIYARFQADGWRVFGTSRRENNHFRDDFLFFDGVNTEQFVSQIEMYEFSAVIFCIGGLGGKSLPDYNDNLIETTVESNLTSVLKAVRVVLPFLENEASIILISSIAACAGSYDDVYAAAKAGVVGLTKSLARNSTRGVRVNCICPGLIEGSSMAGEFKSEQILKHISETPTGELVSKPDLAEICFDLCKPAWRSANGAVIHVNGGRYV